MPPLAPFAMLHYCHCNNWYLVIISIFERRMAVFVISACGQRYQILQVLRPCEERCVTETQTLFSMTLWTTWMPVKRSRTDENTV